jgi:hypothetical protein
MNELALFVLEMIEWGMPIAPEEIRPYFSTSSFSGSKSTTDRTIRGSGSAESEDSVQSQFRPFQFDLIRYRIFHFLAVTTSKSKTDRNYSK